MWRTPTLQHRCITNYELGGTSSKYQVTLPKGRFLQPHHNPKTKYGLAQFINCCLPSRSRISHIDDQNMKETQCEIKHAKLRFLTENLMKIAPAYVKTVITLHSERLTGSSPDSIGTNPLGKLSSYK